MDIIPDLPYFDAGVKLLNKEGVLLAYSGYDENRAGMIAAISANIWNSYEKNGLESFHDDKLKWLLIQCSVGKVAITKVMNVLICMQATEKIESGMLKSKVGNGV
ncbi:unnamed protein product [Soboliphyme baturini]|uniref:Robl_LC7 domain-containing protein n=1 Tax=Soboliphyme baturini TaxID=241478 RepID=A0A183IY91_9BILA|nr:unnamed protein product [Soboliphyme baturini]